MKTISTIQLRTEVALKVGAVWVEVNVTDYSAKFDDATQAYPMKKGKLLWFDPGPEPQDDRPRHAWPTAQKVADTAIPYADGIILRVPNYEESLDLIWKEVQKHSEDWRRIFVSYLFRRGTIIDMFLIIDLTARDWCEEFVGISAFDERSFRFPQSNLSLTFRAGLEPLKELPNEPAK